MSQPAWNPGDSACRLPALQAGSGCPSSGGGGGGEREGRTFSCSGNDKTGWFLKCSIWQVM